MLATWFSLEQTLQCFAVGVYSLGSFSKKNADYKWTSSKRGGGDPRQSKSFGTLFVHQQGGGVDQIQKFLDPFYPDFGEIRHKKCPKSSKKKSAYEKVPQKFQKSGGGGQTFLEKVHN